MSLINTVARKSLEAALLEQLLELITDEDGNYIKRALIESLCLSDYDADLVCTLQKQAIRGAV